MGIKERLEEDLRTALKARDKTSVSVVRLALAEIKNREIEKGRPLGEDELVQLLRSAAKKRKEAIALFRRGGRTDLVDQESAELTVLEGYLPPPMAPAEVASLVAEGLAKTGASSLRDLGLVMKWLMPRLEGRAGGDLVSRLVREKLSGDHVPSQPADAGTES